ncbi:outer membrane protein assembly factor BamE [Martelella sp.]|uniref:outer membrane protein assembly factor BamE domain-containing protein n=1 Tax=Martelella sp. TaxID=1969699 RepID=UPI0025BC2C4C|nr:outer membrane protein assembly factor BamE [Martelella sp.]
MLKTISIAVLTGVLSAGAASAGMLNVHNPNMRFDSVSPALTELDAYFVRPGKPVTVDRVREIQLGASRNDVASLLGQPVSMAKNGKAWDYNLKFVTAEDGEIVCQYKVLFGKGNAVEETVWRRPQCRDLVIGRN